MTIRDDMASLHDYSRWADARMMEAVRKLTPEQFVQEPVPGWTSVRSTIVHCAAVLLGWSRTLRGEAITAFPKEDEFATVDDVERYLHEGHAAVEALIANLTPESLAGFWEGRDPRGTPRRIPLWAACRHIANHSTYHRGQVAAKLARLGVDVPFTDMAFWALENTPQPESVA